MSLRGDFTAAGIPLTHSPPPTPPTPPTHTPQRRLEHVWSIAARNLTVPAAASMGPPPSVYFTLASGANDALARVSDNTGGHSPIAVAAAGTPPSRLTLAHRPHPFHPSPYPPPPFPAEPTGTVVYRSERVPHSANPSWVPMEWAYMHYAATATPQHPPHALPPTLATTAAATASTAPAGAGGGAAELLRAPTVRLRVYASPSSPGAAPALSHDDGGDALGGSDGGDSWTKPVYFPFVAAGGGAGAAAGHSPAGAEAAAAPPPPPVLDVLLDLRRLVFLGFELLETQIGRAHV